MYHAWLGLLIKADITGRSMVGPSIWEGAYGGLGTRTRLHPGGTSRGTRGKQPSLEQKTEHQNKTVPGHIIQGLTIPGLGTGGGYLAHRAIRLSGRNHDTGTASVLDRRNKGSGLVVRAGHGLPTWKGCDPSGTTRRRVLICAHHSYVDRGPQSGTPDVLCGIAPPPA